MVIRRQSWIGARAAFCTTLLLIPDPAASRRAVAMDPLARSNLHAITIHPPLGAGERGGNMDVPEKLVVQDTSGQQDRIELNGNTGDITAGGNGKTGDLLLTDTGGKQRLHVGLIGESGPIDPSSPTQPAPIASYWGVKVQNNAGVNVVQLGRVPVQTGPAPAAGTSTVSFILGGGGHMGIIEIHNDEGESRVRLGKGHPGNDTVIELRNASNKKSVSLEAEGRIQLLVDNDPVVRFEASGGAAYLGGNGRTGDVFVFSTGGDNATAAQATVHLNGNGGKITLKSNDHQDRIFLNGSGGDLWLGGNDAHGDIMLFEKGVPDNRDSGLATVRLAGESGQVRLRSSDGNERVLIDGTKADVWLGGKGAHGDIMLFHKDEQSNRESANATIRLNGASGDIILRNADCAEDFEIAGDGPAEPGTVMVIERDGRLSVSSRAYDRSVAGVVSGAGDLKPGLVLGRREGETAQQPIALTGRVWCRVEASSAPIETGDLLTTSSVCGCAMKALDSARAFGAVIGKALAPLASGQGQIPILVALQ